MSCARRTGLWCCCQSRSMESSASSRLHRCNRDHPQALSHSISQLQRTLDNIIKILTTTGGTHEVLNACAPSRSVRGRATTRVMPKSNTESPPRPKVDQVSEYTLFLSSSPDQMKSAPHNHNVFLDQKPNSSPSNVDFPSRHLTSDYPT